jgi:hypothetical protein
MLSCFVGNEADPRISQIRNQQSVQLHYSINKFVCHSKIMDSLPVPTFVHSTPAIDQLCDCAINNFNAFQRRIARTKNTLYQVVDAVVDV